jgi:hypothetical protein
MNTRTQTPPLWAPPKDWAPADLEILEVTNDVSSSTDVSYHLTHSAGKSWKLQQKGASTGIWTLVGSVPLDRPTIGLQAQSPVQYRWAPMLPAGKWFLPALLAGRVTRRSYGRWATRDPTQEADFFIYLICCDFRKIIGRIKIFDKCTSDVVAHGVRLLPP